MKKILVLGAGYVGLSNAVLLSQTNNVTLYDICKERINLINSKKSPIKDEYIEEYLSTKELFLNATTDDRCFDEIVYDTVLIALPTNYDEITNYFNTSAIDEFLKNISIRLNFAESLIVVKSTIPLGYIDKVKKLFESLNIIFSPEFLREGNALYDNLYPSRIVVGGKDKKALEYADLMSSLSLSSLKPRVFTMTSLEAEAVKLFANTYLAVRISFFNELDTYACKTGLNTENIINGVCADPRIGDGYNNPSFGYGGYCLPKDTKQLLANYKDIPNAIIGAVIESNEKRKEYVFDKIMRMKPRIVGVYKLSMKSGSDNMRDAPILSIIKKLRDYGKEIMIFERNIESKIDGCIYADCISDFKINSDVILANRYNSELEDVKFKVYTRDVFFRD